MSNLNIYNQVRTVPKEAKKEIVGGRIKGFTDINPMWRIKILTETFGPCGIGWYPEITDKKLEKGAGDEVAAFVDINLYIKSENEWSKPIAGTGGSMFVTKEKNGLYTSDECFKMAYTDAISVAAKSLGIGADVYFERDSGKYDASHGKTPMEQLKVIPEQPKEIPFDKAKVDAELGKMNTKAEMVSYWSKHKEWQTIEEFIELKDKHKNRIDESKAK